MDYGISENYVKKWTISSAIRELISNGLDADKETCHERVNDGLHLRWMDGKGVILNQGIKMERRHLLIGESEKGDSQIGQFGEGLKLAALVLCREGRAIEVASGTDRYSFYMANNDFGVRTLGVHLTTDAFPLDGTQVTFDCTETEFNEAKGLFRCYNEVEAVEEHGEAGILSTSGDIYILGVKVCTLEDAVLSYDLDDKTLVNRDRTVVDNAKLKSAIKDQLARLHDPVTIQKLLTGALNPSAYERGLLFFPNHMSAWKEAVKSLWGEKVCTISEKGEKNANAEYLHYKVVDLGHGLNQVLNYYCKVAKADEVTGDAAEKAVPKKQLTKEERANINKAKAFCVKHYKYFSDNIFKEDHITVLVTETFDDYKHGQIEDDKFLYVNRRIVDNLPRLIAVMLHELAHHRSAAGDCNSQFERYLDITIEKLVASKMRR